VVLRKDGYETLRTHREIKAPLWAIPPLDLGSELVGTKDVREWNLVMTPLVEQTVEPFALINRAEALKEELRSSKYTRLPLAPPTPATQPATQPTTRPTATEPAP
jgi:hypothetical protein